MALSSASALAGSARNASARCFMALTRMSASAQAWKMIGIGAVRQQAGAEDGGRSVLASGHRERWPGNPLPGPSEGMPRRREMPQSYNRRI
jgi:hypothetical protein